MLKKDTKQAVAILLRVKGKLKKRLEEVLKEKKFKYETFGKEIEEYVTPELIALFTETGFIDSNADYKIAENKNAFPDFILHTNKPLGIEIKSGNHSKKAGNRWVGANNSQNDLGTLNSWPKKLRQFEGENIFFIFIEYNFNNVERKIVDIKIDHFYNFLGLQKNGLLKYREKDGNLRPKNFDEVSPITTFEQFNELFTKTVVYRSLRIIKRHRKIIKESTVQYRTEGIREKN